MRAGSGALETWSDDARYALSFLHGFARDRSTRCSRWPNRASPRGGRRSKIGEAGRANEGTEQPDWRALGDCFVRRPFLLKHQVASDTLNWGGISEWNS